MRSQKIFLALGAIIIVAVGSILFINYSNDHKECENTTYTYRDADGNKITETKHMCKEKFSF